MLREEAERWVLDGPLPPLAVPATLQASLVARLDRLSSVREVAQAAAVIGREFAHDLLAAASGLPEARLCAAMDALAGADLVQRRGAPPEAVYAFRHALIRDAAHATLLRERRRELHARAAAALERLRPEVAEREPEVLAHHRAEAGDAEAAAALYLHAGNRAAARAALRETRAHLARGLDLLPGVADGDAARRLGAGLWIVLGQVAFTEGGLGSAEAGRAFARAVELCRGLGGDASLADALLGLSLCALRTGDLPASLCRVEEAVGLARERGTPAQVARSEASLGRAHFYLGRFDLARPLLERAASDPDKGATGDKPFGGTMANSFLAPLVAVLGLLDRWARLASGAVELARRAGHLPALGDALIRRCMQAWLVRDGSSLRCRGGRAGGGGRGARVFGTTRCERASSKAGWRSRMAVSRRASASSRAP